MASTPGTRVSQIVTDVDAGAAHVAGRHTLSDMKPSTTIDFDM